MKKNGKIELLRFIFAISILLRHINLKVYKLKFAICGISMAKLGYMGVEFFFLVSGAMIAKSAYSHQKEKIKSIGDSTWKSLYKKISSVLPYHLLASILMIIIILFKESKPFLSILQRLPSILFLQNTGILGNSKPLIASEWFLSAMFIAIFIIYPLIKKNYDNFVKIYAPIITIICLGCVVKMTGYLSGSSEVFLITFKGNFRALGEIALGTICFELSRYIKNIYSLKKQRIMLEYLENICYILVIVLMFSKLNSSFESICLILLTIGLTLTLANEKNYTSKLYNNKVVYYLGNISLPIYLMQEVVWIFIIEWLHTIKKIKAILIFIYTIGLACASYKMFNKKKR